MFCSGRPSLFAQSEHAFNISASEEFIGALRSMTVRIRDVDMRLCEAKADLVRLLEDVWNFRDEHYQEVNVVVEGLGETYRKESQVLWPSSTSASVVDKLLKQLKESKDYAGLAPETIQRCNQTIADLTLYKIGHSIWLRMHELLQEEITGRASTAEPGNIRSGIFAITEEFRTSQYYRSLREESRQCGQIGRGLSAADSRIGNDRESRQGSTTTATAGTDSISVPPSSASLLGETQGTL